MIVGLTGGIGSGKSTVAEIFQHLGIPVFVADEAAKELLNRSEDLQRALKALLGPELIKDGKLDRAYMASKIFQDEKLLEQVNQLIHPQVGALFRKWYSEQSAPYVIREAAILFESGTDKDCARVIVVTAPEELRIKRVMTRSGLKREQILARMDRQWPQLRKNERADYLVYNDHSRSLIKQILVIHEDLKQHANR